jgi:hypothetical protein
MAEKIVKTAKRMQYLIEDLLETTQSMGGNDINIVTKPIDLSRVCRGIVEEFKISHPPRKSNFTTKGNCFGEWDERQNRANFG